MHEMVMQKNYVKAYKLVILLAVVLAVLSAVAVPCVCPGRSGRPLPWSRPMARIATTASMTDSRAATTARTPGRARSRR